MTTIKRDQFLGEFKRDGNYVDIEVNKLDPATVKKLKDAGISKSDLANVAGRDGKISGEPEYNKLFDKVDRLEKDAEPDAFEAMTHVRYAGSFPTKSGEAYEALKREVDIARAQGVLKNSPAVSNSDPHARHVAKVQKDLKDNKLPTSAKGVTVHVMGDETVHGAAVTRTISGKAGLAKDANVRFQKSGEYQKLYIDNHQYTKALPPLNDWTATDYAKLGTAEAEASIYAAKEEIAATRKNLPKNGQTSIGNMSWGKSPAKIAETHAMKAPMQSKAFQDAATSVEAKSGGRVRFDPSNQTHVDRVRLELAHNIANEMKTLEGNTDNQKNLKVLRDGLEWQVKEARKEGLLIFNAAGNERAQANALSDENLSTLYSDPVKGMITVGAVDLSKAGQVNANAMWDGSAKGTSIEIAAPGVDLPIGPSSAQLQTGTSFASPYAASVAALMVAANPKITPDQIEQILTSGRVTMDLQGDRDGKGLLDPVKAVKEAKDLATPTR